MPLNFKKIEVEPPSPILKEQKVSADQMSDDPLSNNIYMVMGNPSDEDHEGCCYVCTWSVRTGLSYIGATGSIRS